MSESRAKAEALANLAGECCGTPRTHRFPTAGQVLCRRYPPTMMLASFLTQPVAEKAKITSVGQPPQMIGTMSPRGSPAPATRPSTALREGRRDD